MWSEAADVWMLQNNQLEYNVRCLVSIEIGIPSLEASGPVAKALQKHFARDRDNRRYLPQTPDPAVPVKQGPVKQGPVKQGPVKQGPVKQGPVKQGPKAFMSSSKGKSRTDESSSTEIQVAQVLEELKIPCTSTFSAIIGSLDELDVPQFTLTRIEAGSPEVSLGKSNDLNLNLHFLDLDFEDKSDAFVEFDDLNNLPFLALEIHQIKEGFAQRSKTVLTGLDTFISEKSIQKNRLGRSSCSPRATITPRTEYERIDFLEFEKGFGHMARDKRKSRTGRFRSMRSLRPFNWSSTCMTLTVEGDGHPDEDLDD
ncbi:hypothetical protein N7523_007306 [Penicillium sp. IBT 18751x]|nr:hypothetical protein N7523_007306 [Penicillium sp. IBT 18751x]